jgi:hypothetical protein
MLKNFIPAILILVAGMLIQTKRVFDAQKEVVIYKAKCDSLQHASDSLYSELLPTQIELGRHLVAYNIFMEKNPEAAKEFYDIISSKTE